MPRRTARRLLALNAALLCILAVKWLSPHALAQPGAARARGEYTMVSGRGPSGGPNAVAVLDSANQEIVALRWDQTSRTLIGTGYRSLTADQAAAQGR